MRVDVLIQPAIVIFHFAQSFCPVVIPAWFVSKKKTTVMTNERQTPLLSKYFLHSVLIVLFHLNTKTKENNLTYQIINATQTF